MTQIARPLRLAAGLALTLFAVPLALGKTTIADLAPPNAFLIAGVDNYAEMQAAFNKTGLRKVWDDPSVQQWFKKHSAEAFEELDSTLEDLDMKRDDIVPPTGMAGFAMWMTPLGTEGVPPVQMLWAGDFGADADNLHTKIVAALEKGEDGNHVKFESEEFAGGTLITITEIETEEVVEEDIEDDGDDWEDWEDFEAESGPEYTTMYYAKAGTSLMLCTSQRDAEDAMTRLAGKGDTSAGADKEFGKAMSLIGTSQAYAVMNAQPLYDVAAEFDKKMAAMVADDPTNPPAPQVMQTLGALGISEIRSVAAGVNFDGDKAMAESTFVVHCPELKGLMSLFAADPRAIAAPSFASADAASLTSAQIHFERLLPVLKNAVQTLPTEMAGQAAFAIPMIEGQIGTILANMGPEIHVIQQYARPYSIDSDHSVFAVAVKDAAAFATDLQIRGQQIGLETRDFEGAQIWSFPAAGSPLPLPPGAEDIAIGLGFGHLFVGKTASVEGAMRLAANPASGAALGADAGFKKAISALKSPGVSFSYTNMARSIAYAKWMIENFETIQNQQLDAMLADIEDPELRAMLKENRPESPAWMKDLPDLSILARELGDAVGEARITPDGIIGTSYLLRPTK